MLRFLPSGQREPNTTYEVTLATGLVATDGALAEPAIWRFTTRRTAGLAEQQIVFLSDRNGIGNLWAIEPDGTGQRQLSAELSPITMYAVAPDGRSLVVGDGVAWSRSRPAVAVQTLTPDGVLEIDPAFSPNGSRIAFGRVDPLTGAGLGLWTRSAAGG